MGVDLCGGNVGMAEQRLQRAQIRTTLKQMRSKRVPKRMWRCLWVDICGLRMLFETLPKILA